MNVKDQRRYKAVVRVGASSTGKVSGRFWGVEVWVGNCEVGNYFFFHFNEPFGLLSFDVEN